MDDPNFEMVLEYSDPTSRAVYRDEAKAIEALRVGIIEVSSKEKPYDIFICYKETDAIGERTIDSIIAQDVYDVLVDKGYRVFFSRITLEDKLGQEYEPYIFAALNSAKVMLVFRTDYEYYNSVWVKNEWSRFLSMIQRGEKKTIIPCYKGIDAYDMPVEFKRLQAQDMGKVGAIQDLVRGVEKILGKGSTEKPQTVVQQVIQNKNRASSDSLIKRAQLYLEEHSWDKVIEYYEKILDLDPESGDAYWIKELAERKCKNVNDLVEFYYYNSAKESKTMSYARRFAGDSIQKVLLAFDEGLKNAEAIQQKSISEKKQLRFNDPMFQKIRVEIDKARQQMHLMDDRLVVGTYITLAVTSSGKVVATEVTDDEFGIYAGGMDAAAKWTGVSKILESSNTIIGITYDG